MRRSLNAANDLPYPYQHSSVLTGNTYLPHQPFPDNLNINPDCILHYTKTIHLVARQKLTFEGCFMAAPKIILEAKSIELIDSLDLSKPITTIAAQTRLSLNCHELFIKGVQLKCYDAPVDIRAQTIRYANLDLDDLYDSATFPQSCKFMEVEIIDD